MATQLASHLLANRNREVIDMAFLNELIPQEDKSGFDPKVFQDPATRGPITLWKWTVDRDRGAFLVYLGALGGPDGYRYYALSWNGQVVRFAASVKATGSRQRGLNVTWTIRHLSVPSSLESQRKEVLALLREAIEAYGWLHDREGVTSVDIEIV